MRSRLLILALMVAGWASGVASDSLAQTEAERSGGLKPWLARINPALNLLGKVTFHLAENKRSPEVPFAFMATYTHRLTAGERPVHLPLARALQEYAGAKNQAALRSLLEPVRKAADQSPWARELLESRRLFQPASPGPNLCAEWFGPGPPDRVRKSPGAGARLVPL